MTGTDTHDTPEAALAAALASVSEKYREWPGWADKLAAAILAAMPDWTLVPSRLTVADCIAVERDHEIARLRAALEEIASDEFGYPLCSLGEAMADIARAALKEERP